MALGPNPPQSFIWGAGGRRLTPDQIAREREIAKSLMGVDTSPVGHWLQGAARMANAGVGALRNYRAGQAEQTNATENQDALSRVLGAFGGGASGGSLGGSAGTSTAMATAPAPDYASARVAQAHGGQGSPNGWLSYSNSGATRSLPISGELESAMSFLPDMGITMDVYSGGQPARGSGGARVGSTRHDHGNAADVMFKDATGRTLDWNNPSDIPTLQAVVQRARASGVTGFGAGNDYMGAGRMHIGFGNPGVWGAGGRGANAPEWLTQAFNTPYEAPSGAVAANEAMATGGMGDVTVAETPDQIMAAEQAMGMGQPGMSAGNEPISANLYGPGATGNGIVKGPGAPGEKRRGPNGQMYQYVETTGMDGDSGGWGWIPVSDDSGISDIAASLTGANVNPDLPMMGGGAGGFLPAQQQQAAAQQAGGFSPELIQLVSSPYVDSNTRQIAMSLLGQHMQKADPMRQLQMQKLQAEVGQMQSGTPGASSSFGNLDAQARAAGLVPGSPEYQEFMLHGGGAPATFRALDMQAQAAGFTPGTPEYNEFMATRGAGLQAGAAQTARNVADIDTGGAAAGAKIGGQKTMEAGFDAWKDYGKLQTSIGNMDEAIAAIDGGAKSGVIYKMLPNITEASASLQNAMDRMGLDVIGSVTFGALSEGEMRLAMQTAAPRDLSPPELRNWLAKKRDAQIKAADMLADAAQYLTKPGNTINGWIERNRAAKKAQGTTGQSSTGIQWSIED